MNRQDKIVRELAVKHGISIGQANDIMDCYIRMVSKVIDDTRNCKNEKGEYDVDLIKTVHIQNFGKFIPRKKAVFNLVQNFKKKDNEHRE